MPSMQALSDLARWHAQPIEVPTVDGFWPFNPSVALSPQGDLVVSVRYANYHLPGSRAQATRDKPGPVVNHVLIARLDASSLDITRAHFVEIATSMVMREWNPSLGLEDLRMIYIHDKTGQVVPCATASAMRTATLRANPASQTPELAAGVLEVVAVVLDNALERVVNVVPLRGAWSTGHQKNWSPFVLGAGDPHARGPFCLYSPLGGGVHCVGDGGFSTRVVPCHEPPTLAELGEDRDPNTGKPRNPQPRVQPARTFHTGAMSVQIRSHQHAKVAPERLALRGGTQLLRTRDGLGPWSDPSLFETLKRDSKSRSRWIGLAHGCEVGAEKFYWHRFYEVDSLGTLVGVSAPFKLAPRYGIEFAAGMARVGDDYVISLGVEDDTSWIGKIPAEDAHALIRPLAGRG